MGVCPAQTEDWQRVAADCFSVKPRCWEYPVGCSLAIEYKLKIVLFMWFDREHLLITLVGKKSHPEH